MRMNRFAIVALTLVAAAAANAVTFSNITVQSPPLSNGASWSLLGNAIKVFVPNAIVGDPTHPMRSGTLNIQYDADCGAGQNATTVGANTAVVTLGPGMVVMNELVFNLDSAGNEIGGAIGSYTHTFSSTTSSNDSATISLTGGGRYLRVKKSFTLIAPDTNELDLAAIAIINQNVQCVPEPASMAALGLGAVALIRRRRAR